MAVDNGFMPRAAEHQRRGLGAATGAEQEQKQDSHPATLRADWLTNA
jgi:hypothetical protein